MPELHWKYGYLGFWLVLGSVWLLFFVYFHTYIRRPGGQGRRLRGEDDAEEDEDEDRDTRRGRNSGDRFHLHRS